MILMAMIFMILKKRFFQKLILPLFVPLQIIQLLSKTLFFVKLLPLAKLLLRLK